MRTREMGVAEVRYRSMELGCPISRTTLYRVLCGEVPRFPTQGALARCLSSEEQKVTAAQIFGNQPLPRWAQESVYGVAA
jgi:hypothetical protein